MLDDTIEVSINYLTDYLNRHYNKKVISLLDEYDASLQEACVNGYWKEMVSFLHNLFNSAFKTDTISYLKRGLMTRITRESFSPILI